MNIAFFTNNYLPNIYGAAVSVESFRKEFIKRGHRVFVFAPSWGSFKDTSPDIFRYPSIINTYKIRFPVSFPYSPRINKIIKNLKIDIVHSHHPNVLGRVAYNVAKKKNVPLVFTWHTLYNQYTHFVPILPEFLSSMLIIGNARNYANRASEVIAPTQTAANIIRSWGVTNKNLDIVPTGIDEERFPQEGSGRSELRKSLGISDENLVLVSVSRLSKEKNVEFLLQSLIPVLKSRANLRFLMVGEGHLTNRLNIMAAKAGLQKRVIITGKEETHNLGEYYAAGDIFVYASKSETQGLVVAEAMYMGLPVVAIASTGISDLIENGVTGLTVADDAEKFAAGVEELIDNKNLRQSLAANAHEVAHKNYTSSVCAEKMLKVYEKLL